MNRRRSSAGSRRRLAATLVGSAAVALSIGAGCAARAAGPERASASDSAAVVTTALAFHQFLMEGDSAGIADLLTADAVILESGGFETRADYLGGHLRGDIEFAQAIPLEAEPTRVEVRRDVAWVVSTWTAQGLFRGRQVNSDVAELMVLTRERAGWMIAAIHWSTRRK